MKKLKKELRLYFAELLIYWSISIAPEIFDVSAYKHDKNYINKQNFKNGKTR